MNDSLIFLYFCQEKQTGLLGHTGQRGQTSQRGHTGQTDLTFKLVFPGNMCRAAFAILAMFLESELKQET